MATIQLKTGEMRVMFETIQSLMADKWPTKFSYWLARTALKLKDEYETSEKARLEIAKEFGTLSEDQTQYRFEGEESIKQYNANTAALLDTDLTFDLPQISITTIDGFSIAPPALVALDKLLTE